MHRPSPQLILAGMLALVCGHVRAQTDSTAALHADTARIVEFTLDTVQDWRARHNPKKAMLYSALVPGSGQIYNRKYWKAPIIWGGMGLCIYFIKENTQEYERYRDGYVAMVDDDPSTVSEFEGNDPQSVRDVADTYHKWRDLSYIALTAVYLLNIGDAVVDANFVRFDVGEDLSLDLSPSPFIAGHPAAGLSLRLALR